MGEPPRGNSGDNSIDDTSDEPVASIPEGPLAEELHIGERLPEEEPAPVDVALLDDDAPLDDAPEGPEGEEE
jgi:hypothetical protein